MPETKEQRLKNILKELMKVGGIEGCGIISRDGLLITAQIPKKIDAETFAAMSATMLGAAETVVSVLKKDLVERVIVESKQTKIIGVGAGPNAILVGIIEPEANLGLGLVEMKRTSRKVRKELDAH